MTLVQRTWPYGTTRTGIVIWADHQVQAVKDERGEGHILIGDARDRTATLGDSGVLTFTEEGGPTGGYWKFQRCGMG